MFNVTASCLYLWSWRNGHGLGFIMLLFFWLCWRCGVGTTPLIASSAHGRQHLHTTMEGTPARKLTHNLPLFYDALVYGTLV